MRTKAIISKNYNKNYNRNYNVNRYKHKLTKIVTKNHDINDKKIISSNDNNNNKNYENMITSQR